MNNSKFQLSVSLAAILAAGTFTACGPSGSNMTVGIGDAPFALAPANLRLSLTDKPSGDAASVNVNVQSVEIFVQKNGKDARVMLAQDVGMVDLLQLQNNVLKTLGDLNLPPNVTLNQVRLILGDGNNVVRKSDGSVCNLKTPSAQQSGVKLLFTPALNTESGFSYAIVLDFDVDSSLVWQGNGGCLLKPVIKVKSAMKQPLPTPTPIPTPGSTDASATPTPSPTPDPSTTTLPTTGTSDGGWSTNTSTTDPTLTTTTQLWFF